MLAATAWSGATPATAADAAFHETKLISDVPGMAQIVDPDVRNPWGIALGPTTPLWVANNGTSTATVYAGANGTAPVVKIPLTVQVAGGPTGQVFNDRIATSPGNFPVHTGGTTGPAAFLFDSIGGQLSGWHPTSPPGVRADVVRRNPGAVYTGLAEGVLDGHRARLFAADAGPNARVDVFDSQYHKVGSFSDPALAGMSPYNVAVLDNKIYVSFAQPPGSTAEPKGAIDVFNLNGVRLRRLVTGGPLNGPWGMVIAPAGWGAFGGALLVGNEDGGQINAFDPMTGAFRGTVKDSSGQPFSEDGLWGLAFGNGTFGTPRDLIYAAGINGYQDGLVGLITPDAG